MAYGSATTANGWGFVYGEAHSMLMCQAWFECFKGYPRLPEHVAEFLFDVRKGFATGYCTDDQFQRSRKSGEALFLEKNRKKLNSGFLGTMAQWRQFYNYFRGIKLASLTNKQLLRLLKKYYFLLVKANAHFKISGGRVFPPLDRKLKAALASHYSGNELEEKYALLLTPTSIDVLQREEADFIGLADMREPTDAALLAHAEKYALHFYNTYDRKAAISFLRKRLIEEEALGRGRFEYVEKLRAEKARVLKLQKQVERSLKREIVSIAQFLRVQGSLRFELKNYWAGAEFRFLAMFEEISRRSGIPLVEMLASFKLEDYGAYLADGKKLPKFEIKKRRHYYSFIKIGKMEKFISGKKAQKEVRRILGKESKPSLELLGTPANAGHVEGRVRIVSASGLAELEESLAKFEDGNILVTTMTQPNMVFLMKKAAAIVTDQGGMTSHAAVASREFGLPCIVGTNFATKRLKDGDLVEVDANKGIVRKKK